MSTEINSEEISHLKSDVLNRLNPEKVQTPQTDEKTKLDGTLQGDFLENVVAADPDSFNVCISCD